MVQREKECTVVCTPSLKRSASILSRTDKDMPDKKSGGLPLLKHMNNVRRNDNANRENHIHKSATTTFSPKQCSPILERPNGWILQGRVDTGLSPRGIRHDRT